MSNMTKTIAILGVVAGLGFNAMSLAAYADETTTTWAPEYPTGEEQTEDNKNAEWDVSMGLKDGKKWVSTDTTVTLEIEDILSITSDNQAVKLENTASSGIAGTYLGDAAVNLNVKSNNSKGYVLTILGTAETNKNSLTNAAGDQIVAGDLTSTTASQWGYYVGETVTTGQTWLAVPGDTAAQIGTKSVATAEAGDDYVVNFGAKIIDGQASGVYEGKVTFTATNNANE